MGLMLLLLVMVWYREILKIQGDSTLEDGFAIIYSKVKCALARSSMPKA